MIEARKYQPMAVFVTLALLVNAIASFLAHHHFAPGKQEVIASAACFDLVVTVPAIYYLLVVRWRLQSIASLVGLSLLSAVRAAFLFPSVLFPSVMFPSVVDSRLVMLAAEAGIAILLCARIRQVLGSAAALDRQTDPGIRIQNACKELFVLNLPAKLLASEIVVFYYAFFSWRSVAASQNGRKTFTTAKKSGVSTLLLGVACLMFVEVPLLHVTIARWNRSAASIATGVGMYGLVWIFGLSRSLLLRPIVISQSALEMYKGFLWQVHVPLADIAAVRRGTTEAPTKNRNFLDLSLGGPPDVVVELKQSVIAEGPFGIRKRIHAVGLSIDEAPLFERTLKSEIGQH